MLPQLVPGLDDDGDTADLSINAIRRHVRLHYDPFESLNDREFRDVFSFPKQVVKDLVELIAPSLDRGSNQKRVPPHLRVLAALYFYSQGGYQAQVGSSIMGCLSRPMVCRAIREVTEALYRLHTSYIQFPPSEDQLAQKKERFMEQYLLRDVVGVIGCIHIEISKPNVVNPFVYTNKNGHSSLLVQIISDADNRLLNVNARFPGSCHNQYIWSNSCIRQHLQELHTNGTKDSKLVGDSAYNIEPWLITPVDDPFPNTPQERYNSQLLTGRNIFERTVGIWKAKFRCLSNGQPLPYQPLKVAKIVMACAVLHNLSIDLNLPQPDPVFDASDRESNGLPDWDLTDELVREAGEASRNVYIENYFT